MNSETNPYGLTTAYLYDSWFKRTKITDYLGKTKTLDYARSGTTNTLITSTGGDDGSYSQELYDELGRKIRSGIKDLQNNMSYKDLNMTSMTEITELVNLIRAVPHYGIPLLMMCMVAQNGYRL